jgi:hypothetical protein
MRTGTISRRLSPLALGLVLTSCSAAQPRVMEPAGPQELNRYVLIIEELPDGRVEHEWKPLRDINLEPYQGLLGTARAEGRFTPVAWQRNCDEELKKCIDQCMGSPMGQNWDHLFQPPSRRLGGKHAECRKRCWPPYEDCNKQNAEDSAKPTEFPTTEKAIDWLKRHRSEVQVGAVVVIAGVAFVALTGGTGALLLGPVLLLASSETTHPSAAASR